MKKITMAVAIICGGLLISSPVKNTTFAQSTTNNENNQIIKETDENTVEVIDVLNKEQAKEILQMSNKDVRYEYQGDENTFEVLKSRDLEGYVFLPDYETDLGFFVDKNTASVYYFHPSGYLELAA